MMKDEPNAAESDETEETSALQAEDVNRRSQQPVL